MWNRTLFNNLFNQIFSSSGEKLCRNQALRFHFSLQLSKSGVGVEGSLDPDVYLFRYLTVTYILAFPKVSNTHRHWALNLAFHCFPANTQGTADMTSRAAADCVSLAQCKWEAVVNSPICCLSLSKVEAHPPFPSGIPAGKKWPWRPMPFCRVK